MADVIVTESLEEEDEEEEEEEGSPEVMPSF